jgi:hypothetical protein
MKLLLLTILTISSLNSFSKEEEVELPPKVDDYGNSVYLLQEAKLEFSHQLLIGKVIDSGFEEIKSLQYSFYYPTSFMYIGIEANYNNVEKNDFLTNSSQIKLNSNTPKNQYGLIASLPFAKNIMNILNSKYIKFSLDLEISYGLAIIDKNKESNYFSYATNIITSKFNKNISALLQLKNTIISPNDKNVAYNSLLIGIRYDI